MQRRLATILASTYEPPVNVHGFAPGRSSLSNAFVHRRQEWVLRCDLKDFFPTINFGRVRGMFMAFPFDYPPDVATVLAQLCCHENELPQGAPTSPIISNFICRRLDVQLANLARTERCYYTRYADDLCFSTDRSVFPASLVSIENGTPVLGSPLVGIIRSNGFDVSPQKTRLIRRTQRQRVTGLVVNDKLNVGRVYVRSLRNLLYIWRKHGEEAARDALARVEGPLNWPPGKPAPTFTSIVRGRVQYVGSVKGWGDPTYRRLARALRDLDPGFRPRTLRKLHSPQRVRLFTEGPSDVEHLHAAKKYFDRIGDFDLLELEIPEDAAAGGDAPLLTRCKALAVTKQPTPCVCVFDRDNDTVLRDAVGPTGSRDWGNEVAAVALVHPEWRDSAKPLSVEMLYDDETLRRRDSSGRRLYLASEFDRRSGHHETELVTTPNPSAKTLVREDVHEVGTRQSVGLSKLAFAQAIASGTPPFEHVSFEGFRPTFAAIEEATARVVD